MPPKIRYTKEVILKAAFELTRGQGVEAINARSLAAKLGCSTQPLFREFSTMDEIRAEVKKMARERYNEYLRGAHNRDKAEFKGMGLAYIAFAREEPELFKLIFMCDRVHDGTQNAQDDDNYEAIRRAVQSKSGLSPEKADILYLNSWIFAHGLATMLATRYIEISDEEISDLLTMEFSSVLAKLREERD